MNNATQELFNNQLNSVVEQYKNFSVKNKDGNKYLQGILDIPNEDGDIVDSFLIEIKCSLKFPCRFPILQEIGQKIPCKIDWHKYQDEICCITVEPDEIVKCKSGVTVLGFIKNYAIPYFANHIYRKETGEYRNGEYAHGVDGLKQYYTELLKTDDYSKWQIYYKNVFDNLPYNKDRNKLCFCGFGIKFKKCHYLIFEELEKLGKEKVNEYFLKILRGK